MKVYNFVSPDTVREEAPHRSSLACKTKRTVLGARGVYGLRLRWARPSIHFIRSNGLGIKSLRHLARSIARLSSLKHLDLRYISNQNCSIVTVSPRLLRRLAIADDTKNWGIYKYVYMYIHTYIDTCEYICIDR